MVIPNSRAFDESPEGHALRYDADETLVGLTIVNAKRLLDDSKPIVLTIPERVTFDPATLAPRLTPPRDVQFVPLTRTSGGKSWSAAVRRGHGLWPMTCEGAFWS